MDRFERFTESEIALHWGNSLSILLLSGSGLLIWQSVDDWQFQGFSIVSLVHTWLFGGLFMSVFLIYLFRARKKAPHEKIRLKAAQRLTLYAVVFMAACSLVTGLLLLLRLYFGMSLPAKDVVRYVHQLGLVGFGVFTLLHLVMLFAVPGHAPLIMGMLTGFIDRQTAFRTNRVWALAVESDPDEAGTPTPPDLPGSRT
jgi:cytochrome b subunit of formate dehydrogenase